ncbi:hypothetical protein TNCV_3954971 [Trichonephila clavipes]|nr:hypothetical protein TNCV_3954971 [Trichonephila clavipes]
MFIWISLDLYLHQMLTPIACDYRFSKWPEASSKTRNYETVAEAFFSSWVSLWNSCNSHDRQGQAVGVSRSSKLLANCAVVFRSVSTTGYAPSGTSGNDRRSAAH